MSVDDDGLMGDDDVSTGELRTYSLAEVVAKHGLDEVSVDPIRWLTMRLNRGELRGIRFGRHWRMRASDVDYMLSRYSNDSQVERFTRNVERPESVAQEPISITGGISARSRRRRGRPLSNTRGATGHSRGGAL